MMAGGVSVVMPFAGDVAEARAALDVLRRIELPDGGERVLADNSASLPVGEAGGVRVVRVDGERSPAHARNAGARSSAADWILFIDSDCSAPPDLVSRYFEPPPGEDVGALAGQIRGTADGGSLAARYGAARNFLDQRAHLSHPYLPRAAAANLLVRRRAFEAVGGFLEGVRAAEDTDFSWRLQEAGWRLEFRESAVVAHRYRTGIGELRRQWRGYAAGRAWLRRRYAGFTPEPGIARALRRTAARIRRRSGAAPGAPARAPASLTPSPDRIDRALFRAIDGVLALEELVGFTLSNRPSSTPPGTGGIVFIAERFPSPGDPLVDLTGSLRDARVEAAIRPPLAAPAQPEVPVLYREDDGALERLRALLTLLARRPGTVLLDFARHRSPSTWELGCVAVRARTARIVPLGRTQDTAARVARLAGR